MLAAEAFNTDVRTGPHNLPKLTSAGVWLFHLDNVSNRKLLDYQYITLKNKNWNSMGLFPKRLHI